MVFFFASLLLSAVFTLFIRHLALRWQIVDHPDQERKLHSKPVPLLGGTAIFLSYLLVAGYLLYIHPIYDTDIFAWPMMAVFLAGFILIVMGALDDAYHLPVYPRLAVTAFAAALVIAGGIGLNKITNPWGGVLNISMWFSIILAFVWLMGTMYTAKISDGLDGLSVGITSIGALIIYFLTQSARFYQPNVGLLALVFAGSCLGFWLFNFYPAKIFLGEGGGLFIGLMLGVLAIIGGGKIATALLVVAVPLLDLVRVAYRRWRRGQSLAKGDREHLHFWLLDLGLKQWQAVLLLYVVAAASGLAALWLQSRGKILLLLAIAVLMAILALSGRLNNR